MTPEQEAANTALNEAIRACEHEVHWDAVKRRPVCAKCAALWVLVLYPRRAEPFVVLEDDLVEGDR